MNALARLRAAGWSVAVHNDYRIGDRSYTFWLFTHPSGCWVKGEGATDEAALELCEHAAVASSAPSAAGTARKPCEPWCGLQVPARLGRRWFLPATCGVGNDYCTEVLSRRWQGVAPTRYWDD